MNNEPRDYLTQLISENNPDTFENKVDEALKYVVENNGKITEIKFSTTCFPHAEYQKSIIYTALIISK